MTGTVPEHGELLHLDPATLTIGTNVRTETHTDAKQFARSIRERGVLEVITAYRDQAGQLVVLRGQRRTIVATQVGTPTGTVPVRVVAAPVEGDRIVDQLAENLHRHVIGHADVLAGIEQLSLVGLSAAQIAKRTALRRTGGGRRAGGHHQPDGARPGGQRDADPGAGGDLRRVLCYLDTPNCRASHPWGLLPDAVSIGEGRPVCGWTSSERTASSGASWWSTTRATRWPWSTGSSHI
jgi:hypothetical protein